MCLRLNSLSLFFLKMYLGCKIINKKKKMTIEINAIPIRDPQNLTAFCLKVLRFIFSATGPESSISSKRWSCLDFPVGGDFTGSKMTLVLLFIDSALFYWRDIFFLWYEFWKTRPLFCPVLNG